MKLGKKISSARRQLGKEWTQERLLEELNHLGLKKSYGWIASLETGKIGTLHEEYKAALSKVLKKPLSYFVDDPVEVEKPSFMVPGQSLTLALPEELIEEIKAAMKEEHLGSMEFTATWLIGQALKHREAQANAIPPSAQPARRVRVAETKPPTLEGDAPQAKPRQNKVR